MKGLNILVFLLFFFSVISNAQQVFTLPAVDNLTNDTARATITIHQAKQPNGTGIIFCPGGGYRMISYNTDRDSIVKWLVQQGITVFVLKYRHGGIGAFYPAPMNDVQQAMLWVKGNAASYKLDVERIGIMGTSAGGHLAAWASEFYKTDTAGNLSSKPAFSILLYPVINLDNDLLKHEGSRKYLIGSSSDSITLAQQLSIEKNVHSNMPPVFIVYGGDDTTTPPENGATLYLALRKVKVQAELHVFEGGNHAFGLPVKSHGLRLWNYLLMEWLLRHQLVNQFKL